MPELPEVEVITRGLAKIITLDEIQQVQVRCANMRLKVADDFASIVKNQTINYVERQAKYILLHLSENRTLVVHLGMTGNLLMMSNPEQDWHKHDHVIFYLKSGKIMIYRDVRRFGLLQICRSDQLSAHRFFLHNGPDPFSIEFNANYLHSKLKHSSIKQALMDNNIVVGIGNIYACEILFKSGINPLTPAGQISLAQCELLVNNSRIILQEAINAGGSSFSDYLDAKGNKGYFQHNFKVYQKATQNCSRCPGTILAIKQGGRSTFYCPDCQR
jgi:formamidopyrimidine-DNA glycosylase